MPTHRETAASDFIAEQARELIYQGKLDEDVLDRFEVLVARERLTQAYGQYFRELGERSRLRENKRRKIILTRKREVGLRHLGTHYRRHRYRYKRKYGPTILSKDPKAAGAYRKRLRGE